MPDISIGRFRGGFCVYWHENGKRKRHQLKARTRAEAEPEAIDLYRRHQTLTAGGELIRDLWEDYRKDLSTKPTAKTMGYTGKAVLEHFGNFRPDQITKQLCKKYESNRTSKGIAVGSIWTELGHLQSTLNWAKKVKRLGEVPHIWRPEKPEKDKRILNPGEVSALIDAAHDPHIRLAIILLFGTAARVGAILDLTWDRVSFEHGTINLRVADGATRKGRAIVPMNKGVRAALSTAKQSALSEHVVEYAGARIRSIRTGFYNAVERSGIGKVTIHEVRHTAAVTMLSAGIPIEKVAQMLGHSNLSQTYKVYARYLPQHMQDAADVLDFTSLKRKAR